MGRGTWQAPVHGVAKSRIWLSDWSHTHSSARKDLRQCVWKCVCWGVKVVCPLWPHFHAVWEPEFGTESLSFHLASEKKQVYLTCWSSPEQREQRTDSHLNRLSQDREKVLQAVRLSGEGRFPSECWRVSLPGVDGEKGHSVQKGRDIQTHTDRLKTALCGWSRECIIGDETGEETWCPVGTGGRKGLGKRLRKPSWIPTALFWGVWRGPCACQGTSVTSDSLQSPGLQPARLLCPWDSPGKNSGVGCHALLQAPRCGPPIFFSNKQTW